MLTGIDVSAYQGTPTWHEVHDAGIEFAAAKATEGLVYRDKQFQRNWGRMRLRGIRRIAYHFLHADELGTTQADFFHSFVHLCGGFANGDCAMLDMEITSGQSADKVIETAEDFVTRFLATTQCGIYLYTYPSFWQSTLGAPRSPVLSACPLWIASYGPSYPTLAAWPEGPAIWQWTSTGRVPGIVGNVDMDRFLGTMEQYDILSKQGGRH